MNNKTLAILLILFSLLAAALITRNGDVAWMMLPFLAYLMTGIIHAPPVETLCLSGGRKCEQSRSNGIAYGEMSVSIQNQAPGMVHLFFCETVPEGIKVIDGELSRRLTLLPGEFTALNYTFTAARGDFSWKSIQAVASDPLGLVETEMVLPANTSIQIRPQIKKFKAIPLRPRSTLHSPGSIPARLGGSGTDFFGVRQYHPGDPLRSLDWRLTARHPGKLFTREFEQEEIADIGLILDARLSTELRIRQESLFEHSLGAAASLAEMFLHQGHRVSLLVFSELMSSVFPGYGKTQLHRIMSCLSKAKVGTDDSASARLDFLPIRMFPSNALIVIISPLTSTDRLIFQRLRAYGYQALLVSPNSFDFAHPLLPQDINSLRAVRAARIERRLQLNDIAQLNIPVIDWQVDRPLFPLVRNALTPARGQRG